MITFRTRIAAIALSIVAVGCGSSATTAPGPAQPASAAIADGTFRVVDVALAGVSTMSQDEARAAIGKTLEIRDGTITYDGKTCKPSPPSRRTEPADAYFAGFKVTPQQVGVQSSSVTVVSTGCEGELAEYAEVDSMLVLAWDGVFYKLQPAP